jgi:hypothetical protein
VPPSLCRFIGWKRLNELERREEADIRHPKKM